MSNIMMNEIIFGTTVVGMVYYLEYGNSSLAMIQREYGDDLNHVQNVTLTKVQKWTNHPIADLEKNVKQIWLQVKA